VQAQLLPGLTTQTTNVRYVSLLTAGRYLRQIAGEGATKGTPLSDFWRRLEALIAVCSVLHHHQDGETLRGIIGKTYADRVVSATMIPLETKLRNPPYNIYRGTLGALGLFDLSQRSDPLYEGAQALGGAWQPPVSSELGRLLATGNLPRVVEKASLVRIAGNFCLCRVPDGSAEQQKLVDLLFGLKSPEDPPQFSTDGSFGQGARVASWRLLLELVAVSPGQVLWSHHLMERILEPDVLSLPLVEPLRQTMLAWRWVAARSFFERGWTIIFNETFDRLHDKPLGLSQAELRTLMQEWYLSHHGKEDIGDLVQDARRNIQSRDWYTQKYQEPRPRECLQLMAAGLLAAEEDRRTTEASILEALRCSGAIPFNSEYARLLAAVARKDSTSEFWAETSLETLIHHVRIGLRKMRYGNPDSLHVDYEDGQWMIPTKALGWEPRPAEAFSRLDVAMGWARQLGLVTLRDGFSTLTALGTEVKRRWDKLYGQWA